MKKKAEHCTDAIHFTGIMATFIHCTYNKGNAMECNAVDTVMVYRDYGNIL